LHYKCDIGPVDYLESPDREYPKDPETALLQISCLKIETSSETIFPYQFYDHAAWNASLTIFQKSS
jgi:hypothetical protein